MGEAKRRNQLDPEWGKSISMDGLPEILDFLSGLLTEEFNQRLEANLKYYSECLKNNSLLTDKQLLLEVVVQFSQSFVNFSKEKFDHTILKHPDIQKMVLDGFINAKKLRLNNPNLNKKIIFDFKKYAKR